MSAFDVQKMATLGEAAPNPRPSQSPCSACKIRHLTVCAPLEESELHQVAAITHSVELGPGDPLFDEGEPANNVYNVTAGTMKVYKLLSDGRRQVTGFLFPGDFLGLANNDIYAYSAEAVSHSTLCRFPRRKLEGLLEQFPKMEKRLLGMASHELAAAQEQMLVLGRKTAKEKVATFLLALSRRAEERGQPADPVTLAMSRADIGDYLGLTTETVSRTFTQLRGSGLIALQQGGKVELRDREALQDISEGG
ncbi:helix-turn-helix domain-containing protein [Ferruginivarius sediminum]|nr:helix-turn-helix domain-containing protein [Ferruginivarius sediminum]